MAPHRLTLCLATLAACSFDASVPDIAGEAADAGRVDAGFASLGPIALYELDEGAGSNIRDTSGVDPPVDLFIANEANITWLDGTLQINQRAIIKTPERAAKIASACADSGESSIEVWETPANTTQGGAARIVSLGGDDANHNFMIGTQALEFRARFRTTETDADGGPELIVANTVVADLTHVVLTQASTGHRRLYVNGVLVGEDAMFAGTTGSWDDSFDLAFGNEVNDLGTRFWLGQLHRVAVFCRSFSGQQVYDRFLTGHD